MKINHHQTYHLSPSKINSISSLPVSVKNLCKTETDVAYANTILIANATNLNEFETNDNIFKENTINNYSRLLSSRQNQTENNLTEYNQNNCTNIYANTTDDDLTENTLNVGQVHLNSGTFNISANNDDLQIPRNNKYESDHCETEEIQSNRKPPLSYQNRFLSLSISPPLSRRHDMPVLRGTFVSLYVSQLLTFQFLNFHNFFLYQM